MSASGGDGGEPVAGVAAEPESAAGRAYAVVRDRILDGEFEDGSMLSEGRIAAELGMSRTPVREAFLQLQAEGWMRLYPKRGAMVRPVPPHEFREVLQARQLIETEAVRTVCASPGGSERLVRRLREVIERQRRAWEDDDLAAFTRADVEFHREVVAAGGNSILQGFHQLLQDRHRRMTTQSISHDTTRADLAIAQHTGLARLIEEGDHEGYARATAEHLNDIHGSTL
ncbi:GntR family transcriptional regulator [Nocardiopsis sp. NPDC006938]|uniref:GntR family transcriptional regulator n=1 Tax=Nocardiopsis sp. NPDC006938 TaxID=3364337 RepID=UPI0036B713A2